MSAPVRAGKSNNTFPRLGPLLNRPPATLLPVQGCLQPWMPLANESLMLGNSCMPRFGDTTAALGMNDFVLNTIRTTAGADPRVIPAPPPPPPPPPATATTPQDATGAAKAESDAAQEAGAEDGASAGAGAAAEGVGADGVYPQGAFRRGRGSSPMLRVEDSSLPNTSSAYRVLTQQVGGWASVSAQGRADLSILSHVAHSRTSVWLLCTAVMALFVCVGLRIVRLLRTGMPAFIVCGVVCRPNFSIGLGVYLAVPLGHAAALSRFFPCPR